MKAATGELNLTVITIIAVGAVLTFFTVVLWPQIQKQINKSWDNATNDRGSNNGYITLGKDYIVTIK